MHHAYLRPRYASCIPLPHGYPSCRTAIKSWSKRYASRTCSNAVSLFHYAAISASRMRADRAMLQPSHVSKGAFGCRHCLHPAHQLWSELRTTCLSSRPFRQPNASSSSPNNCIRHERCHRASSSKLNILCFCARCTAVRSHSAAARSWRDEPAAAAASADAF